MAGAAPHQLQQLRRLNIHEYQVRRPRPPSRLPPLRRRRRPSWDLTTDTLRLCGWKDDTKDNFGHSRQRKRSGGSAERGCRRRRVRWRVCRVRGRYLSPLYASPPSRRSREKNLDVFEVLIPRVGPLHQGAELMAKYGVRVPPGIACSTPAEVAAAAKQLSGDSGEVVVKSQVRTLHSPHHQL